jgi:hypothetical protein
MDMQVSTDEKEVIKKRLIAFPHQERNEFPAPQGQKLDNHNLFRTYWHLLCLIKVQWAALCVDNIPPQGNLI